MIINQFLCYRLQKKLFNQKTERKSATGASFAQATINSSVTWKCTCEHIVVRNRTSVTSVQQHYISMASCYRCEFCSANCKFKCILKVNLRTHYGEKSYKCDECPAAFHIHGQLLTHKMIHQEPTYVCDECYKKFADANNCKQHRETHNDIQKFSCNICGDEFKRKYHLKRHTLTHMCLNARLYQ